jgi:hypothetical protein
VDVAVLLKSNNVFSLVFIVSNDAFVNVAKSPSTTKVESRLEEIEANLRFLVFKIAAIAGNR